MNSNHKTNISSHYKPNVFFHKLCSCLFPVISHSPKSQKRPEKIGTVDILFHSEPQIEERPSNKNSMGSNFSLIPSNNEINQEKKKEITLASIFIEERAEVSKNNVVNPQEHSVKEKSPLKDQIMNEKLPEPQKTLNKPFDDQNQRIFLNQIEEHKEEKKINDQEKKEEEIKKNMDLARLEEEEEKKNQLEIERIQLEEITEDIKRQKEIEQERRKARELEKQQIAQALAESLTINEGINEEMICDTCGKTLNFTELDCHDCKCFFCRETYPSNILLQHYDVCPVNKTLELKLQSHTYCLNNQRQLNNNNTIQNIANSNNNNNLILRGGQRQANPQQEGGRNTRILSCKLKIPTKLSKEKIDSLPKIYFKLKKNESGNSEKEKCMVCMEDFAENERLRLLPCFHKYHIGCIDEWLKEKSFCPICKQTLDDL